MTILNHRLAMGVGCLWLSLAMAFGVRGAAPTEAERQIYAPSRQIDILHVALDVTPDFRERSLTGVVTVRFKSIAKPLEELRLDGVDLRISSITATEKILGWQATAKQVVVTFATGIPAGQEAS
jgi:aminopeptidase N